MRGPRRGAKGSGAGGGPSRWVPSGFSPASLGAAWYLSPSGLKASTGDIVTAGVEIATASAPGAAVQFSASAGARPLAAATPWGPLGIATSNSNANLRLVSATGGPTGSQTWHVMSLVRHDAWSAELFAAYYGMGARGAARTFDLGSTNMGGAPRFRPFGKPAVTQPYPFTAEDSRLGDWMLYEVAHYLEGDPATSTIKVACNGKWLPFPYTNTGLTPLAITNAEFGFRGVDATGGFAPPSTLTAGHIQMVGSVLTERQRRLFARWMVAGLNGGPRIVYCGGDSRMFGAGNATDKTPPYCMRACATGDVAVLTQNHGVSGYRSDNVADDFDAWEGPITHAFGFFAVNDLLQDKTVEQITANAARFVARAKALGAKPILNTTERFDPARCTGVVEERRVAWNDVVRNNTLGAAAWWDLDTALGPYNAANYQGGQQVNVHFTDAINQTVIGPLMYAAIVAAGV